MRPSIFQIDGRWQQLRKLTEISRALTYATSLEEVLPLAVDRAAELLGAERSVLLLADDEGLLSIRASHGISRDRCELFHEPMQEALVDSLREVLGDIPPERFLGVPLVVGGEVMGVLAISRPGDGDLDEEEWLLSALADQAALALEKTRIDELGRFRERLIGIVSHDLRNPISAIAMATDLLLGDDELPDSQVRTVVRIQSSAARASRMISDLLDFTQARLGGGIRMERRPVDVHAVVRQVVEELELANPDRRIEVVQEGDGRGYWDPDRLAQVVSNLASNALQYGVPVEPVKFQTNSEDGWVTLIVHNHGPAIPPDRLAQIFEPMQRAATSGTWRSGGVGTSGRSVGLGLYIVKHIVEAHRGKVTVDSEESAGTTFTVKLPRGGTEPSINKAG